MKAVIWTRYGSPDVLQLGEVAKPVPKNNEILIKIRATTVTKGDCEMRSFKGLPSLLWLPLRLYIGLFRPRRITILGQELAGEIESTGKDVKLFKAGESVFAAAGFGFGAHAEYICLPETAVIAVKPSTVTFEKAAAVPIAGLEALYFVRKGNIHSGQKVLINGAGGSIGTFAVQLAKHLGAEVTGVDRANKLEMLRSIGADHVLDYTQEDFTKNRKTYDVIIDVLGKAPFSRTIRSLSNHGVYLLGNAGLVQIILGRWVSLTTSKKVIPGSAIHTTQDLIFLKSLIELGKIKSVIDRTYALQEMAEAHRYVETGLKNGNVVITL